MAIGLLRIIIIIKEKTTKRYSWKNNWKKKKLHVYIYIVYKYVHKWCTKRKKRERKREIKRLRCLILKIKQKLNILNIKIVFITANLVI